MNVKWVHSPPQYYKVRSLIFAKIIDQERQETVEETTQEPVQEEFDLDQAVVGEEPQQPQPEQIEDLPEKYKNKSAQEILDDTDCIIEIMPKKYAVWKY